jgi:hypothetical protein
MQTRKRYTKKRHGKSKKNRINQKGCGSKSMQKGGSGETIFSRTVYPYNETQVANPTDARQMGGSLKKYSRKYYKKQSGGSGFSYTFSPADHANQPINGKYTETNRFLA